jgi:hypothetical protein
VVWETIRGAKFGPGGFQYHHSFDLIVQQSQQHADVSLNEGFDILFNNGESFPTTNCESDKDENEEAPVESNCRRETDPDLAGWLFKA